MSNVLNQPCAEPQKVKVLTIENLAKTYDKRQVVRDVSFQLNSGQIVGLLGPNGAGKTTSFYMLVGLVQMDYGRIFLDDKDLSPLAMHERARRGIGYLPQEPSIFRKLSIADNIMAVLETRSELTKAQRKERLEKLLEEFHITHIRNSLGMSVSGGERRRAEIARALALDPTFILLDEPFAGVDPIAVVDIQFIIRFLKERGIGVLITDHNVRETLGICDRATIINDGLVLAAGHPAEIVDNENVRRIYLGEHFRI